MWLRVGECFFYILLQCGCVCTHIDTHVCACVSLGVKEGLLCHCSRADYWCPILYPDSEPRQTQLILSHSALLQDHQR